MAITFSIRCLALYVPKMVYIPGSRLVLGDLAIKVSFPLSLQVVYKFSTAHTLSSYLVSRFSYFYNLSLCSKQGLDGVNLVFRPVGNV